MLSLFGGPIAEDDRAMRKPPILVVPLLLLALTACGGGGGSGGNPGPAPGTGPGSSPLPDPALGYTPGEFRPAATFAARCQAPRTTGIDPWTGRPWPDQPGTALQEKHFLRSWTHDTYLWFDEVLDRNPFNTGGASGGVLQYFDLLKTGALTDTGAPKDRFHFTYDTSEYRQLASTGAVLGHGISWSVARGTVPRQLVVEYVQAGTPAALNGVRRGATLLGVDGIDVVNDPSQSGVNVINTALFNPAPGSSHAMTFRDRGGASTFSVVLPAASIAFDAVPVVAAINTGAASVGYLLFNDHTVAAEAALAAAIQQLAAAQVDELVLDLRYNGGGFLDIASELAFMIAGPNATLDRAFERLEFNRKHPTHHPLTGQPLAPTPFHATTQGFSLPADLPLPSLELGRVYVLTSARTCSASEAIINGLRGIGIEVVQIGADTCGKPYGFYAQDNCGTSYFSIQFRTVNDLGFGDYPDGFSSTRNNGHPLTRLPGCGAVDDLTRDLGDPLEGQLRVALAHLAGGVCPAMPPVPLTVQPQASLWPADQPAVRKPAPRPWENNRILR